MFAEELKRDIYVAKHSVNDDGVLIYGEPELYTVSCYNALPTSASADLVQFGTSFSSFYQVIGEPEYLEDITDLDRVYVDVPVPCPYDKLASTADYIVKGVVKYPMSTKIALRSLTLGENDGERN